LSHLGVVSVINKAIPKANGVAIITDRSVVTTEPIMKPRMPKLGVPFCP
jgi:hypothetical protein